MQSFKEANSLIRLVNETQKLFDLRSQFPAPQGLFPIFSLID